MSGNQRRMSWAAILVATLVALAAWRPSPVVAQEGAPVKVTVKVGDTGFDPGTIEVNQGQAVEITFVFANKAYPNDEHIIVFEKYGIESEKLDAQHPEVTVKFVASTSGTFNFKCDVECDAHHDLQAGSLKVKAGAGGAAGGAGAALPAANLTIDPSMVTVRGDSIVVGASLQDKDGKPIAKAQLAFFVEEQFAGSTGLAQVGAVTTGPGGIAQLVYRPAGTTPEKMVVRFPGSAAFDAAEQSVVLPGGRMFAPPAEPEMANLHGIRTWAPIGLAGGILFVWLAFAAIVFQVWRISRLGGGVVVDSNLSGQAQDGKER